MATRYKLTKDQLERIVENFVMESASIESKKAPVKNHIPSQGTEAKKHIKNKMSGDMVEPSEGVPAKPPVMKKKLSQAADAKKHVSNTKMKHTNKAKVVKEDVELLDESLMDIIPSVVEFIKNIDASQSIEIGGNAVPMKEFVIGVLMALGVPVAALFAVGGKDVGESAKNYGKKIAEKFGKGVEGIKKLMKFVKDKSKK